MMEIFGNSLFEIAGLAGVAFYVGSYAALQTGFLRGTGYLYASLNGIAASLVLISLIQDFNLSSAIIQLTWIIITLVGLARLYYVRNGIRFSEPEREFLNEKLSDVENDVATRFFKSGQWLDMHLGTELMKEDTPIDYLYYLHKGEATVIRLGETIATIGAKNYVGEVTCFNGNPASATVKLSEDSHIFRIQVHSLRKLAPLGSILRHSVERSIADDLRLKLAKRNT